MTVTRPLLGLVAVLFWLLGPAVPTGLAQAPAEPSPFAQSEGDERLITEIEAGFDGLAKAGHWLPVQVTVANDGPAINGEIRLLTRQSGSAPRVAYTQPLELAARSRKLVHLAAPSPGPGLVREARVVVMRDGQEIASRALPVRLLGATDFLVGVLAEDDVPPAGLATLRRGGGPVSLARLDPADLPGDAVLLQSLDALVVRRAASDRLTSDQRSALRTWVEAGGQLVVAGGPGWQRSIAGLDDLLPVEGLGARQVEHLNALGRYAAGLPREASVLVTVGSVVPDARVILAQDGLPLIAERWISQGRVTFLAADPSLEPIRSWAGADGLWQRILAGGRPSSPSVDQISAGPLEAQLGGLLAQMMDLGLPGPLWLAGFLLLYVVCVGPLQYVLLRRVDRREWAWLGFPVLAVVFALIAYLGGGVLRGPDLRLGAISVARSSLGAEMALVDTFVGLVAPSRDSYDLAFLDGGTPRSLTTGGRLTTGDVIVELGRPARLPDLRLEARTLQTFHARVYGPAPTPVRADLRALGGRIEGHVTNGGPDRLEDVLVLAAGEAVSLGDIAPGESRPVSLALPTSRPATAQPILSLPFTGPSTRVREGRRSLVGSLLGPFRAADGDSSGGVLLVAWSGATPPRVTAEGTPIAGTAARLLEQSLPVHYGDRGLVIPPGLLSRSVVEGSVLGRGASPGFVVRGPIIFQYELPLDSRLGRVDRLSVHLSSGGRTSGGGAAGGVRVALYRWADRAWVDVPVASGGVADVAVGSDFLDSGVIRLRLEPHAPEASINQLDVSLEGARDP